MAISLSACENFRCQMGPQKKSSQRKRLQKLRSGGAIASTADTKCFFGGKHKKSLRNLTHMTQSWYEESAKQGEKVN